MFLLPISEYPEVVPPSVIVKAQYPGANPKVIAETVASPLEEQINGVEDMLYMQSQANSDGNMTITVTFKLGTDPDKATQLVQNRVKALPRLPEDAAARHHDGEAADADDGGPPDLAGQPLRHDLPAQLRADQREGSPVADPGVGQVQLWVRATTRCACGSIRRRSRSAGCRPRTSCRRSASRTCRSRPA